jgi:hypothetical protein
MALPTVAPTAFPKAPGLLAATLKPYAGITSDEEELLSALPGLAPQATAFAAPVPGVATAQKSTLEALQALTGGAVDSDPRGWTPAEAAGQTERAIARIGQVNPELARDLQQKRTGRPAEEPDRGFFGDLVDGLGDALGGIKDGLFAVLEVIDRPRRAIMEMLADEEGDAWWENAWEGLTGKSTSGFGDVLKKHDILQGDDAFSVWASRILGFVGDVALDPVTYLSLGAGAVGRRVAGTATAKVTMRARMAAAESPFLSTVAARTGMTQEQLIEGVITKTLTVGTKKARTGMERAGGAIDDFLGDVIRDTAKQTGVTVHDDAIGGLLHMAREAGDTEILRNTLRAADDVTKIVTSTGNLSRVPNDVIEKLGYAGVDKATLQRGLVDVVKASRGATPLLGGKTIRSVYQQGRGAAAALGQPRFGLPFAPFGIRWQTHRIVPFDMSKLSFQVGRRFMAGLSGQMKLMKMVRNGSADISHLKAWFDDGWKGLAARDAKMGTSVAKALRPGTGFGRISSPFYSLSESIGGVTAHLTPHARMLRGGGLAGIITADAHTTYKALQENVADSIQNVNKNNLRPDQPVIPLVPREFQTNISDSFYRKRAQEDVDTLFEELDEYTRLMPTDEARRLGASPYWERRIEQYRIDSIADGTFDPEDLAVLELYRDRAVGAEKAIKEAGAAGQRTPEQMLESADYYAQAARKSHEELNVAGQEDALWTDDVLTKNDLRPEDAERTTKFADERVRGKVYLIDGADDAPGEATGVGIDQILDSSDFGTVRGYHGRAVAPLRERTGPPLHVNHRTQAAGEPGPRGEGPMEELIGLLQGQEPRPQKVFQNVFEVMDADGKYLGGASVLDSADGPVLSVVTPKDLPRVTRGRAMIRAVEEAKAKLGWSDDDVFAAAERGGFSDEGRRVFDNYKKRLKAGKLRSNVERGHRHAVRLRKPASEETLAEAVDQAKKGLAASRKRYNKAGDKVDGITDDDMRRIVEDEQEMRDLLGRSTADVLRRQGFDGVVSQDGTRVVVFASDQGVAPVWRVNDNAAKLSDDLGVVPRVFTADVMEMATGQLGRGAAGVPVLLRRLERETAGLRLKDAERRAREILGKDGINVGVAQKVFERDAVKVIARRAADVGGQIGAAHLGQVGRRVDSFGWTKSVLAGDAVGVRRWEYDFDAALEEMARGEVPLMKAIERAAKLDAHKNRIEDTAHTIAQRLAAARRAVDDETGGFFVRREANLERRSKQLGTELDGITQEWRAAVDEANRLTARLQTSEARPIAAMVKAEDAFNQAGLEVLDWMPGLSDMAMPRFMAQEFLNAMKGFPRITAAHTDWKRFMAWWKEWATYVNPGFHIRNLQGSWFNNWLGGVSTGDYVFAGRIRRAAHDVAMGKGKTSRWARTKVMTKDAANVREMGIQTINGKALKEATYLDLALEVQDLSGMATTHGRAFAEGRVGAEAMEDMLRKRGIIGIRRWKKWGRSAGTSSENLVRTAAWVRGMKTTGGDMAGARAFTMMRHGDYQDLTDTEYKWIRDLIPFYKWMRTNTPLQVHQLLENPGKLLAVRKAQEAAWGIQGKDYDEEKYKLPSWMREAFTVPFGGGEGGPFEVVMADLPMSDLGVGTREFFSSFLPVVRPFLESYVAEQETFTGRPLTGKPVEVSGFFSAFLPFMQAVGLVDSRNGKNFISDKTANLLNIVPVFTRFRNWMYEDPKRVKLRMRGLASMAFGVTPRPVDEDQLVATELDFFYSNVEPELTRLREMGYPLPTTDDLADVIGTTDQVLANLGIDSASLSELGREE